jgi:hypothetical protein
LSLHSFSIAGRFFGKAAGMHDATHMRGINITQYSDIFSSCTNVGDTSIVYHAHVVMPTNVMATTSEPIFTKKLMHTINYERTIIVPAP